MKKEYRLLLQDLSPQKEALHLHSRVLLVDGLNTFIRSFAVINQMNPTGHHIGGLVGFLRSLGYAIKTVKPTRVIIVFDGLGGSTAKRNLFPEYKAQRSIRRISNWEAFESKTDESESITAQVIQLIQYLKLLPVDLVTVDKVEADDIIGYITGIMKDEVYIMSTDKDYLQLISDKIYVYSPTKKKIYTPQEVIREFGVTPINYINYKIMCGDKSDNIPGIRGMGPKTLTKLFPELGEQSKVSLETIVNKSKESLNESPIFSKIVLFENQLKINSRLMDISNPELSDGNIQEVQYVLDNPNKTLDIYNFIKLYNNDYLGKSIINPQVWLREVFDYLKNYK